jgi:hypothetical protein
VPSWLKWSAVAAVLLLLLVGVVTLFYRQLDQLYPQEIWKYFRPRAAVGSGSVLYRTLDGELFLTPIDQPSKARRIRDSSTPASGREVVRDAIMLPGGKELAYYATELRPGQSETEYLKIAGVEGGSIRAVPIAVAAGEALRPAVFVSTSGRYLAVTNRDRTHFYYYDLAAGNLVPGTAEAPPERMLWTRNGDVRTPHLLGQRPFATSPDGKLRAQVRDGKRRAPECGEAKCETVQELVISPATIAESSRPPAVVYGVFSSFSAEGWGPVPPQPAQRLYGRLVWSPAGDQLLFSTVDGAETRAYAISVDGKTQPRLVLENGEALDWVP